MLVYAHDAAQLFVVVFLRMQEPSRESRLSHIELLTNIIKHLKYCFFNDINRRVIVHYTFRC